MIKFFDMKKLVLLFLFLTVSAYAQKEMPSVTLKSVNNKVVNVKNDFAEKDKLYVFTFWATWCVPCINELDAINENYAKWSKELNMEVIAVSIDDSRTQKRVKPLLNGKKWPYTVLLDTNQDLKRALAIANPPYTVVVKNKKVVYIHNGYSQGAENELYNKLKQL
jgi:thiol-disulfide isomerase/thioredoxin